jgi:diaminopimelate decarboxylase
LARHFQVFREPFGAVPHLICYSMKACSNLAVLHTFVNLGAGIDIVSGGELFRALAAGADPSLIVFSGVGKTDEELEAALKAGILSFNVESESELAALDAIAAALNKKAPVSLRVNPDVDPKTHPYIATGFKKSKFGIPFSLAEQVYHEAAKMRGIEIVGIDCHIGSQITELEPFIDALKRLKTLIAKLRKSGYQIKYLDLGGGLGIRYDQEAPPLPDKYGEAILREIEGMKLTLILEPGRVIVGNACGLITRVIHRKKGETKQFIVVDAAMNDLIRPSLYGSFHRIQPLIENQARAEETVDVVGPICESGDFLAHDRALPYVERGELLCVFSAGAYGFSMSSNYNSRRRAAEVLVRGDRFEVIRERETFDDLIRGEKIPHWLKEEARCEAEDA